jgi:ankyrin repeat protein
MLSTLQKHTSFDLAFQIISQCVDGIEAASHFVLAENGALLAILSKRLNDSGSTRDAAMYISVCEALIDILCGSNIRHAVSAGEPFPFDLIAPLHSEIQTDHFREFFKHAYRSPHAQRLHGGMVVPGCGDIPSMTLKQLANREEKNTGITVLGYAAAIDNCDAVRMLLQVGADPNLTGSNGKNAMEMTVQHNSHKAEMLSMLQSIREVQVVINIDPSCTDTEACKRITGKSAFELIAPVWDVLLDAAAGTPHPDVSFAIFKSLFDTITAVHPAILENLFVDAVSSASIATNKTPRATASPQALDAPHAAADQSSPLSSTGEPSLQGFKLLASSRAERFLKLLGLIAKKFRRIGGVNAFAQSALRAILKLLKLPTARPLARLCHKLRLVDPTLSDLAISQGSGKNAALSPQTSGVSSPAVDSPECEEEEEEEEEEADADARNVGVPIEMSGCHSFVTHVCCRMMPQMLILLL